MKSKVFFSSEITAEKVVELFHAASNDLPGGILPGKVAVKLHSGEPGNQNFLKPEFWQPIVNDVHGTVVECNTAYDGGRNTTEKHRETMEKHGWSKHFTVDIMDAEGPDAELLIPNGKRIKKVQVGKNMLNYGSMLVLSHFKGHPMGGFGGAPLAAPPPTARHISTVQASRRRFGQATTTRFLNPWPTRRKPSCVISTAIWFLSTS